MFKTFKVNIQFDTCHNKCHSLCPYEDCLVEGEHNYTEMLNNNNKSKKGSFFPHTSVYFEVEELIAFLGQQWLPLPTFMPQKRKYLITGIFVFVRITHLGQQREDKNKIKHWLDYSVM